MFKCIVEGCQNKSKNKTKENYCTMHYTRKYRHGSPTPNIRIVDPNRGCLVEGCKNKHGAKGLCYSHYKHNIDRDKCILKGCNRNLESRKTGLCDSHQDLLRKGADLDTMIQAYIRFDGKCEICGTTDPKGFYKKFHTDHDHKTGVVRGLLCDQCNKGLGNFKDSIVFLKSAVRYLKKNDIK